LFATAAEVAGIALAILDPVRLGLDPHAFDAMLRPVAAGGGARSVGFLRAADADSVRGLLPDTSVGHSGFTGTSVWIDPARGRVYVLLTNRVHPSVPSESFTGTRRAFHATASAIP
jgi:CubicO group peptidase (beta-lactamase class C family)